MAWEEKSAAFFLAGDLRVRGHVTTMHEHDGWNAAGVFISRGFGASCRSALAELGTV
jgi:hypothetical protein